MNNFLILQREKNNEKKEKREISFSKLQNVFFYS
jgi:hypothetical protein